MDEAWLPAVAEELEPRLIVLGNLFRDQLDRYGELERLADDWAALVEARAGATEFVLNADDPLVADLGRDRDGNRRAGVTYFGIEDSTQGCPRSSTPTTRSTAGAAARRTCTSAPSSATSVTTRARTATPTARTRTSRPPRSRSRG